MNPVQALAVLIAAAVFFAVLGGSVLSWALWLTRYAHSRAHKPRLAEPQATVGILDILHTLFWLALLFTGFAQVWKRTGIENQLLRNAPVQTTVALGEDEAPPVPIEHPDPLTQTKPVLTQKDFVYSGFMINAQLVCVALMTFLICVRARCSIKKLGWRFDRWFEDLRVGLQCFLMMTPLILILNAILSWVTKTPYSHPIQQMVSNYPWLLGVAFWTAAVVAPISEEFAFRALLTGWFESIHCANNKIKAFLFGYQPSKKDRNEVVPSGASNIYADESVQQFAFNSSPLVQPYEPPKSNSDAGDGASSLTPGYTPPWWPVILSGSLFGLAHVSYGVSWISLIVFGIILGRLYQWRQSLVPVIFVHMLFNGLSVVMLGLGLLVPNAK